MLTVRLALAQLDTVVGDLSGNVDRILSALGRAEAAGADLCAFPELAVTGYPPEDLLLKPGFVADNRAALEKVAAASGRCAAVVGYVESLGGGPPVRAESGEPARLGPLRLANAAAVCAGGRVVGTYHKRLLPNYGVFDEQRWFTPGSGPPQLFLIGGVVVGVSVCEDVWFDDGPVPDMGQLGAVVVVNINASPYSRGRRNDRLEVLRQRVAEAGCAIAYVNQVGGQDELVFDGDSLVVAADGTVLAEGAQFEDDLVVVDLPVPGRPEPDRSGWAAHGAAGGGAAGVTPIASPIEVSGPAGSRTPVEAGTPGVNRRTAPGGRSAPLGPAAEVYEALVLGTRDYLTKNGFEGAVVGLSGGIDSSLVATVAVDALGPGRVHALAMPSRYSSEGSIADATELARRLGIELHVVPIEDAHRALAGLLAPVLGGPPAGLTDENLQSRIRGLLLMAVSNARGWIVLTTGNKSEMATGYSTLYGDSAGGFAVIKDVHKTLVYEVCRWRNAKGRAETGVAPIPDAVLEKPPSAELRPDQRDDQSLPPYEELDPVLEAYVEHDRTAGELVAEGFAPALVDRVVRLVDGAEYKRRQMPPGVRITTKAFGKDRRMPITNLYRPAAEADGAPGARTRARGRAADAGAIDGRGTDA